jgi:type II secretory ATPase GspE/PulE/Tfp pilus assembly ATPase PilB-like protein
MVGEIRDEETASIALKASQTGHMVLATLHSSSNSAALVRLLDLHISPLLMASGLNLIISQRLVRKLCNECKSEASLSDAQINALRQKNIDPGNIYAPVGCSKCGGTGYKGRIGVFDIMVIDDEVKRKISESKITVASSVKDDEQMKNNLHKQAMKLVIAGVTSLEEIKRIS